MTFTLEPKNPGDPLKSQDWNAAMAEIKRLGEAKVDRSGDEIKGKLSVSDILSVKGNLGVGVDNPSERLEVSGNLKISKDNEILFADNGRIRSRHDSHQIVFDGTNKKLKIIEEGEIHLITGGDANNTSRLVVTEVGNIGIGTDQPSEKLEIAGNLKVTGRIVSNGELEAEGNLKVIGKVTANQLDLGVGSITVGALTSSDRIVCKKSSKDARITVGDSKKSWSMAVGWMTEGDFSLVEEDTAGDRLYIKQSTGYVGIDTSSPEEKLHVNGNLKVAGKKDANTLNELTQISCHSAKQSELLLVSPNSKWKLSVGGKYDGELSIMEDDTVRMHFEKGGEVCIGNYTSPQAKLHLYTANEENIGIKMTNSKGTWYMYSDSTGADGGGNLCLYRDTGNDTFNSGQWLSRKDGDWRKLSDISLKENVINLQAMLDKVLQLRPVSFTWKENKAATIGFIAQEVEQIFPDLVDSNELNGQNLKGISYTQFGVLAIAAIKEMKAYYDEKIASLEHQIQNQHSQP